MDDTKPYPKDLDSPRRDLFNGGLGFVVAHLVRTRINFSCVSTGGSIQLQISTCTALITYQHKFKPPLEEHQVMRPLQARRTNRCRTGH